MSTEVRVPTTGNSGEDVVVLEWLAAEGDQVVEGTPIATLETAKATVEIAAPTSGTLLAIYLHAGDDAPEHARLALVGEPGEATADAPAPVTDVPAPPAPVVEGPAGGLPVRASRGHVSPRAAITAERNGIDTSTLVGSGPGGRVLTLDVLAAKRAPAAPTPPAVASSPPTSAEYTSVKVTGARKVTAQRMHASLQSSAQVTLTRYADAAPLGAYLARLRSVAESRGLGRFTVNDLVLFATARVMADHPEANATFEGEEIRQYHRVDLGVAVDTGRALLVPVIRDAASLSLVGLARATAEAVAAARAGTLSMADMSGGTVSVSNLGGLGVHWFTPVLNSPQVCILGVGRALPASPAGPDLMPLSLTFDHRAIDGAAAATVLADIAEAIESVDLLAAL